MIKCVCAHTHPVDIPAKLIEKSDGLSHCNPEVDISTVQTCLQKGQVTAERPEGDCIQLWHFGLYSNGTGQTRQSYVQLCVNY